MYRAMLVRYNRMWGHLWRHPVLLEQNRPQPCQQVVCSCGDITDGPINICNAGDAFT